MATLDINGRKQELRAADDTPLLWALRDELHLTGAKYGCGKALCGACTVLIDGEPQRACVLPLSALADKSITTIEGIDTPVSRAVIDAWNALEVAQCGYCQPGQVMAATALLSRNPRPSDADIDQAMRGNLCRCATYVRIRAAIHRAAEALA
ncbi:MAG: (2Fe-2S)-binding protein [Gammaproteobacteria bacterium]|nr:(2Fe-2S)-binding protein [Gammaproteobacteria bacterium]